MAYFLRHILSLAFLFICLFSVRVWEEYMWAPTTLPHFIYLWVLLPIVYIWSSWFDQELKKRIK